MKRECEGKDEEFEGVDGACSIAIDSGGEDDVKATCGCGEMCCCTE